MSDFVSVIITTYKRPFEILSRAINSVLNQSYGNLELIVVDDNPKGDSYKSDIESNIKTVNDSRVKLVQHEENKGACEARNTGIKNSQGEYIAFLDDDDEWLPRKIELQLKKFSDQDVGLVYCDSYTITIKDNIQINWEVRANRVSGMVYNKLIESNFIGSTSFVMLKKQALVSCGLFNNNLKSAQDYELWLRISKKYKVDYVKSPLVNYYVHDGERISTNVNNKIQGFEEINKLNISYLIEHPKLYSKRKLEIVPYYAAKYGYKTALLKWWEAVKIHPFHTKVLKCFVKIILQRNVILK